MMALMRPLNLITAVAAVVFMISLFGIGGPV
jgi:hypothetical protein